MKRKHALILLGIATIAFTVILELIDPSHVSRGPTILAFEFAGSRSRAAQIMAEWGAAGRSAAHISLVLDFGYMLSYGLFFCVAGFAIRDTARAHGWRRLAAAGVVVPFFALAAAAFDASENVALLLTLAVEASRHRSQRSARPSSSRSSALPSSMCSADSCFSSERVASSRADRSKPITIDPAQPPRRNIELKARDPDPALGAGFRWLLS